MNAIFPGSFDPITIGHEALIRKALPLFDKVVVAVGCNTQKHCMFSLEQRMQWVKDTFAGEEKVVVDAYDDLTVDYCQKHDIQMIVRGVRNETDFRYEAEIARLNKLLAPSIETMMLLPDADTELISSSFVRELIKFGKNVDDYLAKGVALIND